jgi:hypothetical protein
MVLDDWYRLCILSLKLKFGLSEDSSAVLDGRGWSLRGTTRLSHSDHHPANRHPQSSRHPVWPREKPSRFYFLLDSP